VLALANVQCGDLLTEPGVANVVVSYDGTLSLVVGQAVPATTSATADGTALGDARFRYTISDTSIVAFRNDSLVPLRRGTVDLVVSLISWGFHYPVPVYLDQVRALLRPGGRVILDVRKETDGRAQLEARFPGVTTISETRKKERVVAER